MTVGIFGGSFDPIHSGHAMLANFVAQCNVVDEVWLMVSKKNPIKKHETFASDDHRLRMGEIVAQKCKNVKVTDIEMSLPSPSYTFVTLTELKKRFPDIRFKLIIGSDSLQNFHNWKNHEEIINEFGLLVYPRPGFPLPESEPDGMIFLNGAPEFSISSTLIREYIASGWNIDYFVPPAVAEYINHNKLYR